MKKELLIRSASDLDALRRQVIASAEQAVMSLRELVQAGHPIDVLASLKFKECGRHPGADRPLNLIEQVNQTFTYLASFRAAEWLLERHPEAAPFRLNLGTVGGTDVESVDRTVAAETFATVDPKNNRKLHLDIQKVGATAATNKYVFFMCPSHPISSTEVLCATRALASFR